MLKIVRHIGHQLL